MLQVTWSIFKVYFKYTLEVYFQYIWSILKVYFTLLSDTAVGPHTHIGCLSWFSVNCVKFVLLCSSSEKTIF